MHFLLNISLTILNHLLHQKSQNIMISVIIPVLNEADILEASFRELLRHGDRIEIIAVDGGSSDETLNMVQNFPEVTLVTSPKGRGAQMNEGAKFAKGDILLFLHADTFLPPSSISMIEEVMKDPAVKAGCFRLVFDCKSPALKFFSLMSRINHVFFTYGDQGLFVRRNTFKMIGGFKHLPIMEDVEIQKRLRKEGKFVKLRQPVVTSARRFMKKGPVRQLVLVTILVTFYHLGLSPSTLKCFYN